MCKEVIQGLCEDWNEECRGGVSLHLVWFFGAGALMYTQTEDGQKRFGIFSRTRLAELADDLWDRNYDPTI